MSDLVSVQHSLLTIEEASTIYDALRERFDNGPLIEVGERKKLLLALSTIIETNIKEICKAAYEDFHKPESEMLLTEVYTVLAEIKHTVANLEKWSRPERVGTNMLLLPSTSLVHRQGKGVVLIFAPWNYAFYLAMMPLISAVAAGNVVLLKPAHETHHISLMIKKIVTAVFPSNHVNVLLGEGRKVGELLLDNFRFDHLFFTGSQPVGKWIMQKAATTLTPVTLELGGKSPAIIDKTANIHYAAKKVVWGKFINAGQTCVCADYVLVHEHSYDAFLKACIDSIQQMFGQNALNSENYTHIITRTRYEKIKAYLNEGVILYGGKYDDGSLCIEPTLMQPHSMDVSLMKEEIFGPILPIITYKDRDEALHIVRKNRYPLSFYLFSEDNNFLDFFIKRAEFGGGCINNTVYHLGNPSLPFGGIQKSGMGSYHGKSGFDTFSNVKAILRSKSWFDLPLFYQPYSDNKLKWIKRFFNI